MVWERIRGHAEQVEMFRRAIVRGRLSHAYLFAGPEGVGKRLFARTLAQCLFCERRATSTDLAACGVCPSCRQMQAGTHPDYLTVGPPPGKSVLPIDVFVGPPDRRGREGLCHDLSLRPMASQRRIAVIDDAHLMNAESANALLKTLEEPPPFASLFLIAANADLILPTIRSRCQLVRFAALPERDAAELLVDLEWVETPDEAAAVAAMCEGSLAVAAQLIEPKLRSLRETIYAGLSTQPYNSLALAKGAVAGLEELGGDSPTQRRHAIWLIRFVVEFYREALKRLTGTASAAGTGSAPVDQFLSSLPADATLAAERLVELIDRALHAEVQIQRMTPVPLCLEAMFDSLGRLQRGPALAAG